MSPISDILLPDAPPKSRKFGNEECVQAFDLLTEGKRASDHQEYESERAARGAGESLKNGIRGVAQTRAASAPDVRCKVRPQGSGFVFALEVKPPGSADDDGNGGGTVTAESKREEIDAALIDAGLDPDDYKNKKEAVAALRSE